MRYESPATTRDAVSLLAKETGQAFVLAGGTDLLVRMKMGHIEPDLVVDIKRIPQMGSIEVTPRGFRIGAAVSGAQMRAHARLAKAWPGVVEATNLIGSDQIQGRCTMVGNLCNASPAADSVPAMIAAKAKAIVVGATGRRSVPVEKLVAGPGQGEVLAREASDAVGPHRNDHLAPGQVEIRVMVHLLGQGPQPVDERQGGGEIGERERAFEAAPVHHRPSGGVGCACGDVFGGHAGEANRRRRPA